MSYKITVGEADLFEKNSYVAAERVLSKSFLPNDLSLRHFTSIIIERVLNKIKFRDRYWPIQKTNMSVSNGFSSKLSDRLTCNFVR